MTDQAPTAPEAESAYIFHADGKSLAWDYARGGFAFFVLAGVVGVMQPFTIAWFIMAALLVITIGYILNTVYRHGLRIEMTDAGLASGWRNPLDPTGPVLLARKKLPWDGLDELLIKYFSRKHGEGKEGWIMLRLNGKGENGAPVSITFDGAHEGFSPVLTFALEHVRTRGLPLDDTTVANLEALGFYNQEPAPWTS